MSSEQQYKINLRLPYHFGDIGQQVEGLFDCILDVSGTKIKCNRILLAKNSKWFEEYFEKNPKPGTQFTPENAVVVPINNIQPKYMQNFMDILYKNYLQIDIYNIPHLLKVADFYKFPQITNILRTFYIEASRNNQYLMHFAKEFIENGLVNDAIALAPKISEHFINAEQQNANKIFSIDEIYKALSPPVFAAVLIERYKQLKEADRANQNAPAQQHDINNNQSLLSEVNESIRNNLNKYILQKEPVEDWLVMKYIEEFVKIKGIDTLTEDDKERLAKVFTYYTSDGTGLDDRSKLYMLKYNCDWFPARYARKHVNEILKKRRIVFRNFKKDLKHLGDDQGTNRWYVMSWVKNVRDADTRPEPTPIIEFIRTLGGAVRPMNPIEYGLISIESTKEIIDKRKPENAFIQNPELYFITAQTNSVKPFIKFDIGKNVLFQPSSIYFDSRTSFKENELKAKQSKNAKKDTRGHVSKINLTFGPNIVTDTIIFGDPSKPTMIEIPAKLQKPFSTAQFDVLETDKGSDTFRLTTIEVFGQFE